MQSNKEIQQRFDPCLKENKANNKRSMPAAIRRVTLECS